MASSMNNEALTTQGFYEETMQPMADLVRARIQKEWDESQRGIVFGKEYVASWEDITTQLSTEISTTATPTQLESPVSRGKQTIDMGESELTALQEKHKLAMEITAGGAAMVEIAEHVAKVNQRVQKSILDFIESMEMDVSGVRELLKREKEMRQRHADLVDIFWTRHEAA